MRAILLFARLSIEAEYGLKLLEPDIAIGGVIPKPLSESSRKLEVK